LAQKGCTRLVVLHDLDGNDEKKLRTKLLNCVKGIRFKVYVILIPVQEIEAWLLTDANSLKYVFGMSKIPKLPNNPEAIRHPKEKLRDIVWKATGKHYVNTIHNKRIAAASQISKVKTCVSFRQYPKFIIAH
jgi:hypothetical protein